MFCKIFWSDSDHDIYACEQCRKAYDEATKDVGVEPEGPWYQRDEDEQAGLNSRGVP